MGEGIDRNIAMVGGALATGGTLFGAIASALMYGWKIGKVKEAAEAGNALVPRVRDLEELVRSQNESIKNNRVSEERCQDERKRTESIILSKIDHITETLSEVRENVAAMRNGV